ncbi:MAG: nitroreductase family deazaflavin-dependent oxidoreductase [Acidimicrobiia bacterium]
MASQQALGYSVRTPNVCSAAGRSSRCRRSGRAVRSTAHHVDKLTLKLTGGRTTFAGFLAGIPVLTITTTGRKSGLPRTMPLLGVPIGDDIALVGTNFGREAEPAWVGNLRANPHATVEFRDARVDASAREATPEEHEQVLRDAARIYPGYDKYRERITTRDIPVLILETVS